MPLRPSSKSWFFVFGLLASIVGFHQILWHSGTPFPFTKDDNLFQSLPLIQAQTQIFLEGQLPRMVWGLGAGWDPFSSGQMGLFYPWHFLTYGISSLLDAPWLQMEIQWMLHQFILGLLVLFLAPGDDLRKFLLAVCLIFVPASFLLGMGWWAYGCAHVWWVGLILLTHRETKLRKPFASPGSKALFFVFLVFNFMASHPQMFVWGGLLLFCWLFFGTPRDQRGRLIYIAAFCFLPLVPALAYLKFLAMDSASVSSRPNGIILHFAQPILTALQASLVGTLTGMPGMKIFVHDYVEGPALFFQPIVFVCGFWAIRKRQLGFLLVVVGCYLVLGAQSFPVLAKLNLGPFNGFRWTFKLTVLTAPYFLLWFYLMQSSSMSPRRIQILLAILAATSIAVCYQGRAFNLMGEAYGTQKHAGRTLHEAEACLEDAQVPKGARLVFVGDYPAPPQPVPAAAFTLTGNAVLLVDVNATHLYEHMESAEMAEGHLGMMGRYGNPHGTNTYLKNRERLLQSFRLIGGTHLFSLMPDVLKGEGVTLCANAQGEEIYFQKIPQARAGRYPHLLNDASPNAVKTLPGGELQVLSAGAEPPSLNTTAPVAWVRENGTWRGYPNPLNPIWAWMTLLFFLGSLLVFRRRP